MNNTEFFTDFNWWAVLVGAFAAFMLGSLWHSKKVFGNAWIKGHELKEGHSDGVNMPLLFGLTFIQFLVGAFLFELLIKNHFHGIEMVHGVILGLAIGIGWVGTSIGITYLFLRKSFQIWMIDTGYFALSYVIIGIILSIWK